MDMNEKDLEEALHKALRDEEFIVYFQAKYDTRNNSINGMEALVRWMHPEHGLIFPDNFIPFAEKSDLIIAIDDYVMKKAMLQFIQWEKDALEPGILSLNLAMRQLNEGDFPAKLKSILEELCFNPKYLELEMLEREMMEDPEKSIDKLHQISQMGVGIAIDDFGTGYSSLAYLKKLPLNKLKIDRTFIKDIPYSEDDMAISRAIIALGQSLNFSLVAEGVEEESQVKFLSENGCHYVQGYYFCKPITIEAMTQLLSKQKQVEISDTLKEEVKEKVSLEYAREIKEGENTTKTLGHEIKMELEDGQVVWLKEKRMQKLDEEKNVIKEILVRYDITTEKTLEKLATTDALTQLNNRRNFDKILSREINNASREKKLLAFIMMDIDNFKKYNDAYGHPAGDMVLSSVSASISSNMKRGSDFAFRLGGEEFGVLFYTNDIEGAQIFAERIRKDIDDLNLEHSGSTVSDHITISAGLLVIDFEDESINEQGFYTMADDALYEAKENGKNRVVMYENVDVEFF